MCTLNITLIIATIVGGLTTALQMRRALLWRARARSLQVQQDLHLQTIFTLQQRLQEQPNQAG